MAIRYGRKIVIASHKGGIGKTTAAVHLALYLMRCGVRVSYLDGDSASGGSDFLRDRESLDRPVPDYELLIRNIASTIEAHALRSDVVIIDTPGHESPVFRESYKYADDVLTFSNTNLIELRVLFRFFADVQSGADIGFKAKTHVVLNRIRNYPGHKKQAIELVEDLKSEAPEGVSVSSLIMCDRYPYGLAFDEGLSIHELPRRSNNLQAMAEIEMLAKELGLINV